MSCLDNDKFFLLILKSGGVAWSSGQHRRLPLQGSRVRNSPIASSFFGMYLEQTRVKKCGLLGTGDPSLREERRNEKRERRRVVSKAEWVLENGSVRFEDDKMVNTEQGTTWREN